MSSSSLSCDFQTVVTEKEVDTSLTIDREAEASAVPSLLKRISVVSIVSIPYPDGPSLNLAVRLVYGPVGMSSEVPFHPKFQLLASQK